MFPAWLKKQTPAAPTSSAATVRDAPAPAGSEEAPTNERPAPSAAEPQHRTPAEIAAAHAAVSRDLLRLANVLESERRAGHPLPWDARRLGHLWSDKNAGEEVPDDPFGTDGDSYRYEQSGGEYLLWSVGPDGESDTDDDITFDSRVSVPAASRHAAPPRHH
jgi:hypothetical protein